MVGYLFACFFYNDFPTLTGNRFFGEEIIA